MNSWKRFLHVIAVSLVVFQVCEFWIVVRYYLNYCVSKMCVADDLFIIFDFEFKLLIDYLCKNLKCEPFFVFNWSTNRIEIKLYYAYYGICKISRELIFRALKIIKMSICRCNLWKLQIECVVEPYESTKFSCHCKETHIYFAAICSNCPHNAILHSTSYFKSIFCFLAWQKIKIIFAIIA